MTEPSVHDLYRTHLSSGWAALLGSAVEASATACRIIDDRGREYLDCGSYAVFLLGHGHPAVVAAVKEQIERLPLASGMLLTRERADAAAALAQVAPEGLDRVCFTNSGAEATDVALKLARLNGCSTVIAAEGAFHGMTLGALSVSGHPNYESHFGPLVPGVVRVPFGNLPALAKTLEETSGRACVILEPIQGENGVILPPSGYLRTVAGLCEEHNSVLICDEIQCGLGRTGSWWVAEEEQCIPDVLLTGKVLSGGVVPVAAVVASERIFTKLDRDPMLHGSTFGGSPIQCAAANAALHVIQAEGIVPRARAVGHEVRDTVAAALDESARDCVAEVRGRGLMIGIEFLNAVTAGRFFLEMFDNGVITAPCSTQPSVVRLLPPAVMDHSDLSLLTEAVTCSAAAVALATQGA